MAQIYVAMRYGRYPEDGDDQILGVFSDKETAKKELLLDKKAVALMYKFDDCGFTREIKAYELNTISGPTFRYIEQMLERREISLDEALAEKLEELRNSHKEYIEREVQNLQNTLEKDFNELFMKNTTLTAEEQA